MISFHSCKIYNSIWFNIQPNLTYVNKEIDIKNNIKVLKYKRTITSISFSIAPMTKTHFPKVLYPKVVHPNSTPYFNPAFYPILNQKSTCLNPNSTPCFNPTLYPTLNQKSTCLNPILCITCIHLKALNVWQCYIVLVLGKLLVWTGSRYGSLHFSKSKFWFNMRYSGWLPQS